MNHLKQLAGQTAVYGLGIVLPRLLNYLLLTPFYTRQFTRAEYGIITELYAYVVFLIVILTYGMETGFFRYAEGERKTENVYKTALISLFSTSAFFILIVALFNNSIADVLDYSKYPQYILWLAIIVALDAFTSIPFARIRYEDKALKYALIRITEVLVNITANWFFIYYCAKHYQDGNWISRIYNPDLKVGYVLVSNLMATGVKTILLYKEIFLLSGKFKLRVLKELLVYSLPLLVAGLAGTVNEALDRILLKYRLPGDVDPMAQLGIYGANFKLAVLMTLFIQMFRYAAEPFFFSKKNEINAKEIYSDVMQFFVFFCMVIFLFVTLYIDIFKLFIGSDFRGGIGIVPVILIANLFMGIYYNLSIWFKLTNKTKFGAFLVVIGALVTIVINYFYIPDYGFYASAWAHFLSYLVMIVLSYYIGQKHYHINYNLKKISTYIFTAILIYFYFENFLKENEILGYIIKSLALFGYIFGFLWKEEIFKKYMKRKIVSVKEKSAKRKGV